MIPRDLQVGYVPYSADLTHPADRRRFCFYAKRRGLHFEVARPGETYDIVVLSERADITWWSRYPYGRGQLIYELVDSYLAIPPHDLKGILRGVARFAAGESRYVRWSHKRALEEMCRRAEAVVCTSEAQRASIGQFCSNVHVILDIHSDLVRSQKQDYRSGDTFTLVWEGMGENVVGFQEIRDVLLEIGRHRPLALHVVTDPYHYRFMSRFFKRSTLSRLHRLFPRVYLHPWAEATWSSLVSACDLGVIPVRLGDPFAAGKPANKLLLLWRLGMPTVVSATAEYSKVMEEAGLSMACQTEEDWFRVLSCYMEREAERRQAADRGRDVATTRYGEEEMLRRWDHALLSVLTR